ncbi:MAG: KamA family protein [Bacteroidales bacterium]|nr:KamA family protein [Bacteroidales bacterium]
MYKTETHRIRESYPIIYRAIVEKDIHFESAIYLSYILDENPDLGRVLKGTENFKDVASWLRRTAMDYLENQEAAIGIYTGAVEGHEAFARLSWRDMAAIRILDFLDHEGMECNDLNLRGKNLVSRPFETLWKAARHGKSSATADFFRDMYQLFRQFYGRSEREVPGISQVGEWMDRYPSGMDPEIVEERKRNRDRIIRLFIRKIDNGEINDPRFRFEEEKTFQEKYRRALVWWKNKLFHLRFAIRGPESLNEYLGHTLNEETMETLRDAEKAGIPFFVNPYYLSMLLTGRDGSKRKVDQAIRDYIFHSRELIEEFGYIVAWEKEDIVEAGRPNVAGWILPNSYNIHRRYPDVAILIPDTVGRACGGLCVSCQRMYDFQNGHLNFNLERLKPKDTWWDRLPRLLQYFEQDTQLCDILITGGDALMSSDKSLERILDEVYRMACRKKEANSTLPEGEKFAGMIRVRLGTRLPVYLPQRITTDLAAILSAFRDKAIKAGISQFFIQTHFESPLEVTPEAARAVRKLIEAGWTVTNQLVFTAAASRRGHTAKLRKVLNDIGVLPYYTFTVKGYRENRHNFACNSRVIQEQVEEKQFGRLPDHMNSVLRRFHEEASHMHENIDSIRLSLGIPFLATDRNVLNLPGVGKSLTFRTVGLTQDGRRILEFDHDHTRRHSPMIEKMGKVIIIESKSTGAYIRQLEKMGENPAEYESVWGYTLGFTEERSPLFEYPDYPHRVTHRFSNLEI